jgi:hypothetical protein
MGGKPGDKNRTVCAPAQQRFAVTTRALRPLGIGTSPMQAGGSRSRLKLSVGCVCSLGVPVFVHPATMKLLLTLLLWTLLLVLCWPLALLILVAWPFLWLLSIPFRIVGTVLAALLAFVKALLFLPARLLGYREPSH